MFLSLLPNRNRDRSVKRLLKQEQKLPDDLKLKPSKALLAEQVGLSRVSCQEIKLRGPEHDIEPTVKNQAR